MLFRSRNDSQTGQVTAERDVISSGVREVLRVEERESGGATVRTERLHGDGVVAALSEDEVSSISRHIASLRERATIVLGQGGRGLQPAPG